MSHSGARWRRVSTLMNSNATDFAANCSASLIGIIDPLDGVLLVSTF
jgi:hypothetical protein